MRTDTVMLSARVPRNLHRQVRAHAALEGKSVQQLVTELLETIIKTKIPRRG